MELQSQTSKTNQQLIRRKSFWRNRDRFKKGKNDFNNILIECTVPDGRLEEILKKGFVPNNYSELLKHSVLCDKTRYEFKISSQKQFEIIVRGYMADRSLYISSFDEKIDRINEAILDVNGVRYTLNLVL